MNKIITYCDKKSSEQDKIIEKYVYKVFDSTKKIHRIFLCGPEWCGLFDTSNEFKMSETPEESGNFICIAEEKHSDDAEMIFDSIKSILSDILYYEKETMKEDK